MNEKMSTLFKTRTQKLEVSSYLMKESVADPDYLSAMMESYQINKGNELINFKDPIKILSCH